MVALYFATSQCPLCTKFTKKLIEFYNEINLEDKILEIILVSRDKNKEDFEKLYNDMPWHSLPCKDGRIKKLIESYEIKGIPVLALLNKKGEIAFSDGRRDVCTYDDTEFI
jgi:nucleoredoxin